MVTETTIQRQQRIAQTYQRLNQTHNLGLSEQEIATWVAISGIESNYDDPEWQVSSAGCVGMVQCDPVLQKEVADKLRESNVFKRYPGRNFSDIANIIENGDLRNNDDVNGLTGLFNYENKKQIVVDNLKAAGKTDAEINTIISDPSTTYLIHYAHAYADNVILSDASKPISEIYPASYIEQNDKLFKKNGQPIKTVGEFRNHIDDLMKLPANVMLVNLAPTQASLKYVLNDLEQEAPSGKEGELSAQINGLLSHQATYGQGIGRLTEETKKILDKAGLETQLNDTGSLNFFIANKIGAHQAVPVLNALKENKTDAKISELKDRFNRPINKEAIDSFLAEAKETGVDIGDTTYETLTAGRMKELAVQLREAQLKQSREAASPVAAPAGLGGVSDGGTGSGSGEEDPNKDKNKWDWVKEALPIIGQVVGGLGIGGILLAVCALCVGVSMGAEGSKTSEQVQGTEQSQSSQGTGPAEEQRLILARGADAQKVMLDTTGADAATTTALQTLNQQVTEFEAKLAPETLQALRDLRKPFDENGKSRFEDAGYITATHDLIAKAVKDAGKDEMTADRIADFKLFKDIATQTDTANVYDAGLDPNRASQPATRADFQKVARDIAMATDVNAVQVLALPPMPTPPAPVVPAPAVAPAR